MSTTNSRGLIISTVGGDSGAWGGYLNSDMGYITQMFGSVLELSVSSGATLTTTQTQNGVIRFTGTINTPTDVSFPNVSGVWWIDNRTTGSSYVRVKMASGSNATIGLPQGVITPIRIESGTDGSGTSYPGVWFGNTVNPGSYWDYAGSTTPGWFSGCTSDGSTVVYPWLPCDGLTLYSASTYAALYNILGTTWGGTSSLNFKTPDLRNRARVSLFSGAGTAPLTSASGGIDGTVYGATGGADGVTLATSQIPAHTHTATVIDPGHTHPMNGLQVAAGTTAIPAGNGTGGYNTGAAYTNITVSNANAGGGLVHTNTQPTTIAGLTFIKT
jgi:microcystin-dependent protein